MKMVAKENVQKKSLFWRECAMRNEHNTLNSKVPSYYLLCPDFRSKFHHFLITKGIAREIFAPRCTIAAAELNVY